ncbi:MAG: hypothetical protein NC092_04440 [Butyrivibrio sp.]|nr:hypothetical protein [Muribaculum sp.]MCM1551924.1 hypothetical protein [Butyrivibrio sp.]
MLKFDEKKVCKGFCKVFFPLEGEQFDNEKKSEFKALLNMLYSARTLFAQMDITDDYGLAASFLESKKYKIVFRELSDEEIMRAKRVFDGGYTTINNFITMLMIDLRGLSYNDAKQFINLKASQGRFVASYIDEYQRFGTEIGLYLAIIDSFLYETADYKNQGPLRLIRDYYGDLNGVTYSVMAFMSGIAYLAGYMDWLPNNDPKSAQVHRLYYHSYLPLYENAQDDFTKCILAYRFFVSIYDWLGFKYVEKTASS